MNSTVKERLLLFLKSQGISQRTFTKTVGLSPAFVNSIRVSIQPKTVEKICKCYTQLNSSWLLTGEGEMLKKEGEAAAKPAAPDYRLVPIIHIDSVGGMHSENSILSPEYIEGHIPMTGARSDDVAIYQSGDSMSPAIPSGALLLLREVEDWYEYIGYGNVFVLLLNDGRRITKEVQRYREDPENYYWCVSYNPNVADEELPKRMIRRVWKVIKVLVDNGW